MRLLDRIYHSLKYRLNSKNEIRKKDIYKLLPPNPVILEAGAHNGNDTIQFAIQYPKGKIYAFEPLKEKFSALGSKLSKYDNVEVFNLALGIKDGQEKLNVSDGNGGASSSLLDPKMHLDIFPDIRFKDPEFVNVMTLDSWADQYHVKSIDFMWLDLQGMELKVLRAAPRILETVQLIYTEIEYIELYKEADLFEELHEFLLNQEFHLVKVSKEKGGYSDALFKRGNK